MGPGKYGCPTIAEGTDEAIKKSRSKVTHLRRNAVEFIVVLQFVQVQDLTQQCRCTLNSSLFHKELWTPKAYVARPMKREKFNIQGRSNGGKWEL